MRRIAAIMLASLGLAWSLAVQCAQWQPAPYQADYSLARNSFTLARAHFSLEKDGDAAYIYKAVTRATGLASLFASDLITETSRFELADGRPRPLSYSYSQTGGKHEKSENISFDWQAGVAHSDEDGRKRDNPLSPGMSDTFLITLMLSHDAAEEQFPDGYKVLDHREITAYGLKKLPEEKLKVGDEVYDTVVLERRDPKKDRVTEVWLCPALHYLPVQIQQREPNKATFTLTLEDISFGGAAPAAATKK